MADASPGEPDFGALAESYDRLRPVDSKWWEIFEVLVAEGDLLGRRVLEVGTGTGTLAGALADRGTKVWAVDPSEEMLAGAREKAPGARFKLGRAESLPFKDGWFERVVVRLALHLVDRSRALPEFARVLAPGGRLVVATFDPAHFEGYWLNDLFPSLARIDEARFPDGATLVRELEEAGFSGATVRTLGQDATATRAEALERIRGRFISTLRLLEPDEYERGLERAERELPPRVDYRLEWLVVTADRLPLDAVRLGG
ncbi:MAG: methyltransferase domain-containing protein [Gaiellaceae bacterium]